MFHQKVILAGRSQETYKNYLRAICQVALYYQQLPTELTDNQINDYLLKHKLGMLNRKQPSEAYFKHTVFGFRYLFKTFGIADRLICMPVIKRKKTIPDILNRAEVIDLLHAPNLLKHRILFALAYGSGLRVREVQQVRVEDIDVIRKTVHVRNSKNGYDRMVPIGQDWIRGYMKYKSQFDIDRYIFPGKQLHKPLSIGAIQHALISARRKAGIVKKISMHNLRHSYATHFIEDTGDLLRLKNYLGHRDIKNTLRYLKMAQVLPSKKAYSPLSKVFELARSCKLR